MQKGKKKILAMGLALSVLCSSVNAGAYSNMGLTKDRLRCDEKRAVNSEMVMTAVTRVEISGKTANLSAGVTCNPDIESIDAELILQIYAESAWPTVQSWSYTENQSILLMDRKFTLNASGKYRTKCIITAHQGSETEKITIYSAEKNYTHKTS